MISRVRRAAAAKSSQLLAVLANPTRLLIVQIVNTKKGAYVHEIAQQLGMSHSAVSHQLGALADAGVVASQKEGRAVRYYLALTPAAKHVARILKTFA